MKVCGDWKEYEKDGIGNLHLTLCQLLKFKWFVIHIHIYYIYSVSVNILTKSSVFAEKHKTISPQRQFAPCSTVFVSIFLHPFLVAHFSRPGLYPTSLSLSSPITWPNVKAICQHRGVLPTLRRKQPSHTVMFFLFTANCFPEISVQ